ncbi:hypothetical protein B0J11DRAFT_108379 [Dendryphion nanum]|uniref:Uncharacterized protein n=1 Tax=Dendryphion nanum TaxID=256645 RepID=A0A9P9IDS9_9PLEO|nr:hypothetical protein B0J11DRAFT_108379 [Dendryphion nanum]
MSTHEYSFTPPPVVECAYAPDHCSSIGKKIYSSTKVCQVCISRHDTQESRTLTSSSSDAISNVEPEASNRRAASDHSDQASMGAKSASFDCAFTDPHFNNSALFTWRGEPGYQPPKNEPCSSVKVQGGVCKNCLTRISSHWKNRPKEQEKMKRELAKFFRLSIVDELDYATHNHIACPFNTEQCSENLITFVGEERWPCWNCIHSSPDRLEKEARGNPKLLDFVQVVRSHLQGRAKLDKPYVCVSQDPKYMFESWRRKSWKFRIPHIISTECLLYTCQQQTLCAVCQRMAKLQGSDLYDKPDNWYEEIFDPVTGKKRK